MKVALELRVARDSSRGSPAFKIGASKEQVKKRYEMGEARKVEKERESRKVRYSFSCRSAAGQRRRRPEPQTYRTRLTASAKWERVGRWYRQFGRENHKSW